MFLRISPLEKLDTSRANDANGIRMDLRFFKNIHRRSTSKATGPNVAATHLPLARAKPTPSSAIWSGQKSVWRGSATAAGCKSGRWRSSATKQPEPVARYWPCTQNCASFHCGILALEPVERRRFVMTEHWEHCPSGWCKKKHVQPSNRAWGWLPSDKIHNHPHSHPVAIRRAPCCAAGKPPGPRREYSAGVVWDIGYG